MMEYSEKLKDPRWQKLRLEIFERDEWTCQWCGNKDITLSVHHLYYEKNKEPWEYPMGAFLTLCQPCHQFDHKERHVAETALVEALRRKSFSPASVMSMAEGFQKTKPGIVPMSILSGLIGWVLSDTIAQKKLVVSYCEYLTKKNDTD